MPKKTSQKLEILFSILVITILLEIVHFTILSSELSFILNKSFFFGNLGSNSLAIFVSLFFILIVLIYVKRRYVSPIALIFLLSGAVTNVVDRLIRGGSVDYLHLLNIPLFNIPDVLIVLGLAIFFFEIAL